MPRFEAILTCAILVGCGGAAQQAPASRAEPSANNSAGSSAAPATEPPAAASTEADAIARAVASAHRADESRARDAYRRPAETLAFFGVKPTQHVVELWPGRGWYTEILAPLVHEQGQLTAVAATGPYLQPYKDFLASSPERYGDVKLVEVTPPESLSLGPDASADVVLTFRNLHSWVGNGYAKQLHEAIYRVLKPGGTYGVVEHRAAPGTSSEATAKSGYVTEETAIALATDAGFVLEERSELNANSKDTKDHPSGVWSLPPSLRGGDVEREKYQAIGESDRMTLRFRKPVK